MEQGRKAAVTGAEEKTRDGKGFPPLVFVSGSSVCLFFGGALLPWVFMPKHVGMLCFWGCWGFGCWFYSWLLAFAFDYEEVDEGSNDCEDSDAEEWAIEYPSDGDNDE